jgi:hypothetical protein
MYDFKVSMGMLENVLGFKNIKFSLETVNVFVQNHKKYLIILVEKFIMMRYEVVCNLHHINEPQVAFVS